MGIAGMVIGIISMVMMCIALVPFLGWINWGVIPLAIVGLIVNTIAIAINNYRGVGIAGAVLCLIALIGGNIRLLIGCGIF